MLKLGKICYLRGNNINQPSNYFIMIRQHSQHPLLCIHYRYYFNGLRYVRDLLEYYLKSYIFFSIAVLLIPHCPVVSFSPPPQTRVFLLFRLLSFLFGTTIPLFFLTPVFLLLLLLLLLSGCFYFFLVKGQETRRVLLLLPLLFSRALRFPLGLLLWVYLIFIHIFFFLL